MFRKIVLTLAATAAIGAAALTPASAGYYGHSYGHKSYGHSYYAPKYYSYTYAPYCFKTQKWVYGDYGPVLTWVTVCR
jgi:hypothetical protein